MAKPKNVQEKQKSVELLLEKLSKRESTDTVFNPYRNKNLLNNLTEYLLYLIKHQSSILLVGESPGYRGCRLTGIPFTSGSVIRNSPHKIFKEIGHRIILEKVVSETTGTIMWEYYGEDKPLPILWNSFPFHPFRMRRPESNRRPTSSEVLEGVEYLKMVYEIFEPKLVCSLGRVGEKTLKETFPDIEIQYIRHPSHGGKSGFIEGMEYVYH